MINYRYFFFSKEHLIKLNSYLRIFTVFIDGSLIIMILFK